MVSEFTMNKTVIALASVVLIIGLFAVLSNAEDPPIACTDTDAFNYEVRGTVTYDAELFTDECIDENRLREFVCSGNRPKALELNCRCSEGTCIPRRASRPYHLAFENQLFSGVLPGSSEAMQLDSIAIRALTGTIKLGSDIETSDAFLLMANRVPEARQHIGKIAYQTEDGEWQLFDLEITTQTSGDFYYSRFNNIASSTAADAGKEVYYVPERATRPTPEQIPLLIQGAHTDARAPFPDSWNGNIQIVDGYNSESNQGGTWEIPFDNLNSIGLFPGRLNENFRSVSYNYYVSTEPVHSTATDWGLAWPADVPGYKASVRRQFRSPAGTAVIELTRNRLELRQPPAYINHGALFVQSFEFQCQDTDAEQDIYRPGRIEMRHAGWTFMPYGSNALRDSCQQGTPPSENEDGAFSSPASLLQFRCGENNLPVEVADVNDCPTSACNALGNACARGPATFTCEDTDAGAANPAYNYGQVRIRSGGSAWTYGDSCLWRDGVFSVSEYSCGENGVVVSSVVECPAGCEWQGGDPYVYIGRCVAE
ncbi:hypothetical protein HY571_01320 [Candidatus Micrarchaeota archaeon]|nr:hypothetical protein [Candidatus Micrarchaeota archaeon]